ncbi:non-canonical purine NTP pyrophosphatase [Candidatus Woesearchaeota archaeon]|nr:non-canonical purine NTP pyrophosphatase [Candidatus Woesearchaeota archaeon]
MRFVLVSSNQRKIDELVLLLKPEFDIEVRKFEYPELKLDDPCEISMAAAKMLASRLCKPVIVEDSGFFIQSLNGFPGTCTKYVHTRIGNDGLLRVMKGVKSRACFYRSAVAVCSPGSAPLCFFGEEEGRVAEKASGVKGWGQDAIFIPKGKKKTYGELGHSGFHLFRQRAVERLKAYFASRRK